MKRITALILSLILTVTSLAVGVTYTSEPVVADAAATKLVAFTFDDGPSYLTPQLLDGLASIGAKATFFCNGENGPYSGAANRPSDVERMVREGHQVANHTYAHRVPFDELSSATIRSEVAGVNSLLYNAAGGSYQTLVRTPGGALSSSIRSNVGAPIILWSVDTMDWKLQDATAVCNNIINNVQDGSVILVHDLYAPSITGALRAMNILKTRGYQFVTVSELFRRRGVTLENGKVYTGVFDDSVDLPAYKAPTISVSGGSSGGARVTLTAKDSGLTLYYTLDGSTPTLGDARYSGPVEVPYDKVLTVAGFDRFGTRTPLAKETIKPQYEAVFNASYYLSRYPELRESCPSDAALLTHFLRYGLHEGRQASPIFSVNYYMTHNPQLKSSLGTDRVAYMNHFQSKGMAAGLRGSEEFDPVSYRLQYYDLRRAYGNNWSSYYYHYLRVGRREGRDGNGCTTMMGAAVLSGGMNYSAVYNYEYYTTKYPDIKKAFGYDDVAVLKHFIAHGMKEKRQGCVGFDVMSYVRQYPDLRNAFGNEYAKYYRHYILNGKKEGRRGTGCSTLVGSVTRYQGTDYAAVYNFRYYQQYNPDVKALYGEDDIAALRHFVTSGMKDGRRASAAFDVVSYRNQYADLRRAFGTNTEKYYRHFMSAGKREGRQGTGCTSMKGYATVYGGVNYAAVYDYNDYVTRYPDIKKAFGQNDTAALRHFVTFGMKEGRQASPLFRVQTYRSRYADLNKAYGARWERYYRHYLQCGQREGRRGC